MQVAHLIVHAERAVAIGRGGGGIDKAGAFGQRPLGECFSELVIVAHQVVGVLFRGGGAGTEVEDDIEFAERLRRGADTLLEITAVDVIMEPQRHEILPLLITAKAIADDDILVASAIEFPNKRAADESGTAGDEDATFR